MEEKIISKPQQVEAQEWEFSWLDLSDREKLARVPRVLRWFPLAVWFVRDVIERHQTIAKWFYFTYILSLTVLAMMWGKTGNYGTESLYYPISYVAFFVSVPIACFWGPAWLDDLVDDGKVIAAVVACLFYIVFSGCYALCLFGAGFILPLILFIWWWIVCVLSGYWLNE